MARSTQRSQRRSTYQGRLLTQAGRAHAHPCTKGGSAAATGNREPQRPAAPQAPQKAA